MSVIDIGGLIASDEAGFACSKTKLVDSGLPHLRPFNISDDGCLNLSQVYQVPPTEAPPSKAQLLEGDILFNNTNSAELVGKSAIVPENMSAGFSNHLTRIRVDRKFLDPAWFNYWLRRLRSTGYFTAHATQWVSQAAYRSADLAKLRISLPRLDEQRRIVDLLSRAEGIVRLRREAQKKAAEIIPALFLDMFGDPATNPNGWPKYRAGEVADVQGGLQVTAARATLPLERPYLRVANVYRSYLDLQEVKQIRLTESELARTRLRSGDLLIVEGHGNPLEVGRVAMWFDEIADCVHQNHLIRARPHRDVILPRYACAFLNSEAGRAALLRSGKTTSGLSTISTSNVKDAPILIPPLERQAHFESLCCGFLGLEKQQSDALARVSMAAPRGLVS